MRKIVTVFISLLLVSQVFGQVDSIPQKLKQIEQEINEISKKQTDLLSKASVNSPATPTVAPGCSDCGHQTSWKQKVVIGMPVLLFVTVIIFVALKLKAEGYQLKNALEDEPIITNVPNPAYDATTNPGAPSTVQEKEHTQSTSRLIAFLSGMCAIVISISTVTYYFYMYFHTGHEPNIEKLYDILLALGIGVTPYALNKVASSISSNKT